MNKKVVLIISLVFISVAVFAASYANNEYQKLARSYSTKATEAYDEGNYDLAVEYTLLAEENAEKSQSYIQLMLAKADAETQLKVANNKKNYAEQIQAEVNYPMAYTQGVQSLENGEQAFANEDYIAAYAYALEAIEAFSGIKEITPLPQFYVVRPWVDSKDCFWTISGRDYIYANPTLWENLYYENKSLLKDPDNADLIHPGIKLKIPSVAGEYRDGVYSSSVEYEPFGSAK